MIDIDRNRTIQRWFRRFLARVARQKQPTLERREPVFRLPETYQAAARSLVDFEALNKIQYRERKLILRPELNDEKILEFLKAFQKELERRGYPFYAFELFRSGKRQDELKLQGRSKAGAGSSPHNYGCAVDIVHTYRYWDLTTKEWAVIGAIGKEVARKRHIKIVWGGDWSFYDPAHWELEDWRERVL